MYVWDGTGGGGCGQPVQSLIMLILVLSVHQTSIYSHKIETRFFKTDVAFISLLITVKLVICAFPFPEGIHNN